MRPSSLISYLWVIVASQATKEHATATFSDTSEIPPRGLQRTHHCDERTRIHPSTLAVCYEPIWRIFEVRYNGRLWETVIFLHLTLNKRQKS